MWIKNTVILGSGGIEAPFYGSLLKPLETEPDDSQVHSPCLPSKQESCLATPP